MSDVYKKTPKGQQVLQDRSVPLPARQRMAFIMFDGQASLQQILKNTAGLGFSITDLGDLLRLGLLAPVEGLSANERQARYEHAYPIAVQLTSGMGLRGFKLNLAVEAAMGYEDLVALLPDLQKALGQEATETLRLALEIP